MFITPTILYRDQAPINYCYCHYRLNIAVKRNPYFFGAMFSTNSNSRT